MCTVFPSYISTYSPNTIRILIQDTYKMAADLSASTIFSVGSIDERGYLNGFDRRGFTPAKCFNELIANSLDAIDAAGLGPTPIEIHVLREKKITIGDKGKGMDRTGVQNMFALHRENHAGEKTRGVSGIGAKPALCILSEKKHTMIFTRKLGGEHIRVDVPWDVIFHDGIYTGMVTIKTMTEEEIAQFGRESGTVIYFPYTETLINTIRQNFNPKEEIAHLKPLDPLDRTGIVFGRDRAPILYYHFEKSTSDELLKYNYFDGDDLDFYTGVNRDYITLYYCPETGATRFIWNDDGQEKECNSSGGGYEKTPSLRRKSLRGWVEKGEFEALTGIRRDKRIFDEDTPIPVSAADVLDELTESFKLEGPEREKFIIESKLVRNGQTIGTVPIPDITYSSARANGDSNLKYRILQCEVRFAPVSSQINIMDNIMAVEENKNKHNGSALPITFTRLVKAIRDKKATEILEYFNTKCEEVMEEEEEEEESEEEEDTGISIIELLRKRKEEVKKSTVSEIEVVAVAETSVAAPAPSTAPVPAPLPIVEPPTPSQTPIPTVEAPAPLEITYEKPASPVDVETPEEESVSGFEMKVTLEWLLERINPDMHYTDDYVALYKLGQALNKKSC